MTLSPEFCKMRASCCMALSSVNGVECKLPLSEEECGNILSQEATAFLISAECLNGEVRYGGKVLFTIIYKSENQYKKCETGVEFSFKFSQENAKEGLNVLGRVCADNVKVSYLNGIATASALIVFKGELSEVIEKELFANSNSICVKENQVAYSVLNGIAKREFKVEDEFEIGVLVEDVLTHSEKVFLSSCQAGIGSVIIDGEIEFKGLILPLGEGLEPVATVKRIPFRTEIDASEVTPTMIACGSVSIKDALIKVFVDEGKKKSTVSVEIMLDALARLYEDAQVALVEDAYSITSELKLAKSDVNLLQKVEFKTFEQKVHADLIFLNAQNTRLIVPINDKIEEINYTVKNGLLIVEGAVSVSALFAGDTVISDSASAQFSLSIPIEASKCALVQAEILDFTLTKSSCDFTLHLSFSALSEQDKKVIVGVEEGSEKVVNNSAISVYIASAGDTLWEVAKALNTNQENVLQMNKDLVFPLEQDERIVIYREIKK